MDFYQIDFTINCMAKEILLWIFSSYSDIYRQQRSYLKGKRWEAWQSFKIKMCIYIISKHLQCGRLLIFFRVVVYFYESWPALLYTTLHCTLASLWKTVEAVGAGGRAGPGFYYLSLSPPSLLDLKFSSIFYTKRPLHTHTLMLFYVFLILSLSSPSSFPNVFPLSRHTGPWEKVGQQLPTKRRQQISTLNQIGASFENFPDQSNEVEAVMAFGNTQKKHQKKIFLMSLDRRRLQRSYLWKAEHRSIMTKTFELQPFLKEKLFCDFHVSLKPFSCSSFSLIRYLHASRSDHLASSLLSISTFTYS